MNRPQVARVFVWDLPVRLFHWVLAAAFTGAMLTAESERLRVTHVRLGYAIAGLVVFRIVWGFAGRGYARFSSFVTGPSAVWRYLRAVPTANAERHVGHNPAGAAVILGLLSLALATGLTGWLGYEEIAGDWVTEAHELAAYAMLALVGVHVAGVVLASLRHRENLVAAMVTGWKRAPTASGRAAEAGGAR
ncbi:MAG: cytochrome b/b6 domain-containing protein [Vicinamibacterales bacterium]|nr:cytochrome b/b6 domain-containing protein [Vicinamibacterales bacterium]